MYGHQLYHLHVLFQNAFILVYCMDINYIILAKQNHKHGLPVWSMAANWLSVGATEVGHVLNK